MVGRARAGNLYVNRVTNGAIVLRQPFGGMAKSAIGPRLKVGGWNYPLEFSEAVEVGLPGDRRRMILCQHVSNS